MSVDDHGPGRPHDRSEGPAERALRAALRDVAQDRPVPEGWTAIRTRLTDDPPFRGGAMTDVRPPSPASTDRRRRLALSAAAVLAVAALAAAVLLAPGEDAGDPTDVAAGPPTTAAAEPERGGTLRYGVASLPDTGYCLVDQWLDGSQRQVAAAFYETLTVRDAAGGYAPYLASAVTPNADHTVWDITLRPDITFHDGTALTAAVVKDNLDAYRGWYASRSALIPPYALAAIATTEVVDDLRVRVTMSTPWVAFPAALHASGRMGILASAQLDASAEGCAARPVGTGPFRWVDDGPADTVVGERNPDYWQTAPDGRPYPYADRIEFTTAVGRDGVAALADGSIDVLRTDDPAAIDPDLRRLADDGSAEVSVTERSGSAAFLRLDTTAAPFSDPSVRRALALALDRSAVADAVADGLTVADGPFAPGAPGSLDDPGVPAPDAAEARRLLDAHVAGGGSAAFRLTVVEGSPDAPAAAAVAQQAEAVGFDVEVVEVSPAQQDQDLIAGAYQVALDRTEVIGDPDQLHHWWHGEGNPLGFGRAHDPVVDDLLDRGRREPDPEARRRIYEDLTRRVASQVADVWLWHRPWAVGSRPGSGSVTGPPLPGPLGEAGEAGETTADDPERRPATDLADPHSLLGLSTGG